MRKWYPLFVVVLGFVVGAAMYPRLPERVVTHWDIHNRPNGWSSRAVACFLLPTITLVLWPILRFLPRIDPLRANYAKFQATYDSVINLVLTLLLGIHLIVLAIGSGAPIDVGRIVPACVGLLLIAIGNLLPRARRNWWFGIRTPWTLSSDRVWERTHRFGGYLFIVAGAILALSVFLPTIVTAKLIPAVAVTASLASVVYSYFVWKQEGSK